jgi:hypothetical protein
VTLGPISSSSSSSNSSSSNQADAGGSRGANSSGGVETPADEVGPEGGLQLQPAMTATSEPAAPLVLQSEHGR